MLPMQRFKFGDEVQKTFVTTEQVIRKLFYTSKYTLQFFVEIVAP